MHASACPLASRTTYPPGILSARQGGGGSGVIRLPPLPARLDRRADDGHGEAVGGHSPALRRHRSIKCIVALPYSILPIRSGGIFAIILAVSLMPSDDGGRRPPGRAEGQQEVTPMDVLPGHHSRRSGRSRKRPRVGRKTSSRVWPRRLEMSTASCDGASEAD